MDAPGSPFYITGGTLPQDAASYVERHADRQLGQLLRSGDFCYVLTSRQMGKSSLMVRAIDQLRRAQIHVAALDLTAIGLNLTPEQWYDGLLLRLGRQVNLEDELEDYWQTHQRLGPVQRWFSAVREVLLPQRSGPVVLFIDEIDTVRSLPFSTDEFFAAIRECYNRRAADAELSRLTFCLLGVATASELIRNPHTTPFSMGHRIELTDFTAGEVERLWLRLSSDRQTAAALGERIYHWAQGHPYLTQRLCRAVCEQGDPGQTSRTVLTERVDALCESLFLSGRAREQDDNLLFVRERILRTDLDLARLLGLYEQVLKGEQVPDDETNDSINQLRLSGVVTVSEGYLRTRNRIYSHVFDQAWIESQVPDAEIEHADGTRQRLRATTAIGRASTNQIVLADAKVSRRHALIQPQKQYEFWLLDLGSSNGTFVNGRRLSQPFLLRDRDLIEIGPFRLIFRQSKGGPGPRLDQTSADQTVYAEPPGVGRRTSR